MSSTTPQTVRSLLRLTSRHLIHPGSVRPGAFVCTQCHVREFSGRNSNYGSKNIRSPSIRNEQWVRQWSSSATRRRPVEKDKPSEVFHMPAPSDHTEDKPADSMPIPASPDQPDASHDSIAMQTPSSSSGEVEKPSESSPDVSPTEPSPAEEVLDPKEPEQPSTTFDPVYAPAPKSKASFSEPSSVPSSQNALPSETAAQRWQLSENTQKYMDDFLAKAAIFSQRLNNYTGTDYSGIEALRREIVDQEREVKTRHAAIATTKEAYQQAYAAQAASQKEVVGLLERKHSWSAGDLERYMSLIRSEHLNEQAVQRAKDELAGSEHRLEEARSTLERKERKQYHEEQVWSDTIRRNSTWVTFGLMGLNILLLLANLAIIEPWRRRRMVKEIRTALEDHALQTNAKITAATATPIATTAAKSVVEEQIDETVEPAGAEVENVEDGLTEAVPNAAQAVDAGEAVGDAALAAGEVLPQEAVDVLPELSTEGVAESLSLAVPEALKPEPESWQESIEVKWEHCKKVFQDMFSDRQVTVKKIDMTTVALESAAAGVAIMGLLVVLFNPR